MLLHVILLFAAAQQPWSDIANDAKIDNVPYYSVHCENGESDERSYVLVTSKLDNSLSGRSGAALLKSTKSQLKLRGKSAFTEWQILSAYNAQRWEEVRDELRRQQGGIRFKGTLPGRVLTTLIECTSDRLSMLLSFPANANLTNVVGPSKAAIQEALAMVLARHGELDLIDSSALLRALSKPDSGASFLSTLSLCLFYNKNEIDDVSETLFDMALKLPTNYSWDELRLYHQACLALEKNNDVARLEKLFAMPSSESNPKYSRLSWLLSDPRLEHEDDVNYQVIIENELFVITSANRFADFGDPNTPKWIGDAYAYSVPRSHPVPTSAIGLNEMLSGTFIKTSIAKDPSFLWGLLDHKEERITDEMVWHGIGLVGMSSTSDANASTPEFDSRVSCDVNAEAVSLESAKELAVSEVIRKYCDATLPGWIDHINLPSKSVSDALREINLQIQGEINWVIDYSIADLQKSLLESTDQSFLSVKLIIDEGAPVDHAQLVAAVKDWWQGNIATFDLATDAEDNGLEIRVSFTALSDVTGSEPSSRIGRPDKKWAQSMAKLQIGFPGDGAIVGDVTSRKYYGNPPNPRITDIDIVNALSNFAVDSVDGQFLRAMNLHIQNDNNNE
jgi:hypothetical protein